MKKVHLLLFSTILTFIFFGIQTVWAQDDTRTRDKEIEEILSEINKDYHELYTTLQEVKKSSLERYHHLLTELREQWPHFLNLRQRNPELSALTVALKKLEIEIGILRSHYQRVPDADKKKVKEDMRSLLNDLFELKVKKRQLEVKSLETELNKLKSEMKDIQKRKNEIIEQRLEQITGGDVFSW